MASGGHDSVLGTAYSRACEFTCDRYGLAATSDKDRALDGLCILAAGGNYGARVNRRALVAQRADLNTVMMKIGEWLSTHPPIAHRLEVLDPGLSAGKLSGAPRAMALGFLLAIFFVIPASATIGFGAWLWPEIEKAFEEAAKQSATSSVQQEVADPAEMAAEAYRAATGSIPPDVDELYSAWGKRNPLEPTPLDPFDGDWYGYIVNDGEYRIYSVGPEPAIDSDDIYYSSAEASEN